MALYVNMRIGKTADGTKWLVEGQNASTYNWDEMLSYPAERERSRERAIDAACKLALDFSKKTKRPVSVIHGSRELAVYQNGVPFKR